LTIIASTTTPVAAWRALGVGWVIGTALQLQFSALWPWPQLALAAACCVAIGAVALWWEAQLWRSWPSSASWQRAGIAWSAWIWRLLLGAALAWCCVGLRASWTLSERLSAELEGQDLDVVGVVAAMPQRSESGLRFRFEVSSATRQGRAVQLPPRVYLAWYGGSAAAIDGVTAQQALPLVQAGERWQWRVRLKAPHGHMNPGGFDYELWLWEQGLQATGYVRTGAHGPAPVRLAQTASHPVEWLRQSVRDAILARFAAAASAAADDAGPSPPRAKLAGIVAALVVGDQNAIDRSDWDVFRATGVAHLMSISGLHVTLFAWFASAVLGALWRRTALWGWSWCLRWPAPHAAAVGGLLLASAYAVFSGWGVPAQRTVWMLAVVVVLRLSGRVWPWPWIWFGVLAVVVMIDPWALYQAGFWLSFVAVGVLFAAGSATTALPSMSSDPTEPVLSHSGSLLVRFQTRIRAWLRNAHQFRGWVWLRNLLREQWMVTWALTPLSILFFGQISVVGLVANLLAIPWVTLVVTPLAMAGVMWSPLWSVAVLALSPLQSLLGWMAALPWASAHVALPPLGLALAALLGGWVVAMPWPWSVRCLGLALWLPALAWHPPRPAPGHFEIQAPDLGQGNAVLVRTAQHSLLYDAGPRYSVESDAGHRVVVPLLQRLDLSLDRMVLSHRDSDHTGGAAAVLAWQPHVSLLSSLEPEHALLRALRDSNGQAERCEAGQSWQWDGVRFEVLHPLAQDYRPGARSNSLSCVLRISNGAQIALLVGDIEAAQEAALLARNAAPPGVQGVGALHADVLLVPHHGSKTSSTPAFIDAVAPRWAWVQAGYRNRFGHPASEVVARYRARGIALVDSAHCGAMQWTSAQAQGMQCERDLSRRYWHHGVP
jgi:competence protein ComEC